MELLVVFSYIFFNFHVVFGQDIFQGAFRQIEPCFETKNSGCNASLVESFTPKSPNIVKLEPYTLVYLFTPESPEIAEALHECGGRLPPDTTYAPAADTEVFIHGWMDGVCRTAWMRECKEQLYQRACNYNTSYNVILVDWTWGNTPDYTLAGSNSRIVGEQVGFVINNIIKQTGIDGGKFHIIGHSFGAIASGFIGRSVEGLRRITALDPAYAPFMYSPPDDRITFKDATIVDVIHSNALKCFAFAIGDDRHLGHADFYPNGGLIQSSCIPAMFESFLKGDLLYALASLEPRLCSHLQAIQFYKLSINPNGCQYVGVASDSYSEFSNRSLMSDMDWAVMGMDYELYHKEDGKRRKYYLTTTTSCPYYDDSYLGGKKFPFRISCSC